MKMLFQYVSYGNTVAVKIVNNNGRPQENPMKSATTIRLLNRILRTEVSELCLAEFMTAIGPKDFAREEVYGWDLPQWC